MSATITAGGAGAGTGSLAPRPRARTPRRLSAIGDVSAMSGREFRRTIRSVDALVTALAIPVSIMLVFVVVFGGAIQQDGGYIDYVVPGTLILCAGFGSASTAIAVAQDMTTGTIDRFKTLPIYGASVLVGHVLASVMRNLVASALVIGVALALGFRPSADLGSWVLAILFLSLVIVAMTWVACAAGLVLSVDAAGSINFVFLFLPYLSTGFVEVDTMPEWLRGFAEYQPYTPIIETLRSLLTGSPMGGYGWQAIAWLLGLLVVGYVCASVTFRRRTAR
ncbi:ABC transporter permease [Compostimonas suwonensis]|uniref:Transport permease protein n=1 Tax=Compostimonas suwonensis TaxID=1048394 RepID=A0A2M9BUG6_9MICO|nr:ABC transporter permease [Compostimonas suwonensis]PJJ61595.1 ABC-2 type transport system permease protein [Compostimonas suwonensis]